ncbi:hypothetical protein Mapa_005442 [Marchantia paleacea]|nr:hypothetical protein Mapa_005442 [Marchantia paleacea]
MAAASLVASATRELSITERNWCSLQKSGTGIVVAAFWFARQLSKSSVQAAVIELVNQLPYLNSQIRNVEKGGEKKLFFQLRKDMPTVVEEVNPFTEGEGEGVGGEQEEARETWSKIVDLEGNKTFPIQSDDFSRVFQVVLYQNLPNNSVLVVLRFQASAFDCPSLEPVVSRFFKTLRQMVEREEKKENVEELMRNLTLKDETLEKFTFYPSMEDLIPKGLGEKNILSKGFEFMSTGLKATSYRYFAFDSKTVKKEQKSRHIRASLSRETTDRLIQACKSNSTDLYGAFSSAFLKSLADYKRMGKKGEQYSVAVLYDCRNQLSPPQPESVMGFYHSAMLATAQISESAKGGTPFWKFAAEVTKHFQVSVKENKHFKDIKLMNSLMVTALNFPNLTPEGSLRTATYSILHDPATINIPKEEAEYLQLKDHVVYISVHGAGPCVAIYVFLEDGAIKFTFCYPSPMFSRLHIQTVIDTGMQYLTSSL